MKHTHEHIQSQSHSSSHGSDGACCLPPEDKAAGAACHAPAKAPQPAPAEVNPK